MGRHGGKIGTSGGREYKKTPEAHRVRRSNFDQTNDRKESWPSLLGGNHSYRRLRASLGAPAGHILLVHGAPVLKITNPLKRMFDLLAHFRRAYLIDAGLLWS